jgi:hypothetical protein
MKSWPHLGDRGEVVLKAVQQVARWTLPSFLCHDNMGARPAPAGTCVWQAGTCVWGCQHLSVACPWLR